MPSTQCLMTVTQRFGVAMRTCQQVLATDTGSNDTVCCDCLHLHYLLAVRGGSRMGSCHIAVVTSEHHCYLALFARCM